MYVKCEEEAISKIKLALYKTFRKNIELKGVFMGLMMQELDFCSSSGQEHMA